MKSFRVIVLMIFCALGLISVIHARGTGDEKVRAEILEILQKYGDYLEEENLEAWVNLHTEDIVKMPPGSKSILGRKALLVYITGANTAVKFVSVKVMEPQELKVIGNLAYTWTYYIIEMLPRDGVDKMITDGKALTIYRKGSDGKWLISHDCYNSNVP